MWTLVCVPQARLRYVSAGAASLLAVALVLFLATGPGESGEVANTQRLEANEEAPHGEPAEAESSLAESPAVRLVCLGATNVSKDTQHARSLSLSLSLSLARSRGVSSCRLLACELLPPSLCVCARFLPASALLPRPCTRSDAHEAAAAARSHAPGCHTSSARVRTRASTARLRVRIRARPPCTRVHARGWTALALLFHSVLSFLLPDYITRLFLLVGTYTLEQQLCCNRCSDCTELLRPQSCARHGFAHLTPLACLTDSRGRQDLGVSHQLWRALSHGAGIYEGQGQVRAGAPAGCRENPLEVQGTCSRHTHVGSTRSLVTAARRPQDLPCG